jgi:hypothetical protein
MAGTGPDTPREPGTDELTRLQVDYLMLADGAQVVGGKLYLLGGGWDRLQLPDFPGNLLVAVVLGVRVPWPETNRRHTFRVRALTADAERELLKVEGEFEVGRAPGLPPGMSQLFQVAAQGPLQVPAPGSYFVEAVVDDGAATRTAPFFAVKSG